MDGNSDSGKSISIDWDTDDEIEIESTPLSSGLGLAAADQEAFAECGETRLAGSYVKSFQFDYSESYRRTIDKGKQKIYELAVSLRIEDGGATNLADKFYKIAVERSFTKGRRTEQVVAACLYIACRYVLGAVFLQLCQLLSLQEHDIVQKAVDPSLFIDRYTNALVGENMKVSKTALLIIASMKRDWMQTGRKPSGLCGAAVYISALSHGIKCSKSDIGRIVHVCEATLTKRLIEFENTDSGSLTIEEFIKNADVLKKEDHLSKLSDANYRNSETTEVLCQHKDQKPHFAGLCKSCCQEFIELSGGLHGGADPPAFQIAERERLAEASSEKVTDSANLSISAIWKAGGSAPPWRPPKSSMNYKHQSKCDGRTESIWRVPSSAQTAAEATRQMLTKKGLSSKINYDVLDKLFDDQVLRCHQDSHYALDHLLCSVWEAMDRL